MSGWRQVPSVNSTAWQAPALRAWESRTGPEAQAQIDSSAREVEIAIHHAPRRLELERKLEELLDAPDRSSLSRHGGLATDGWSRCAMMWHSLPMIVSASPAAVGVSNSRLQPGYAHSFPERAQSRFRVATVMARHWMSSGAWHERSSYANTSPTRPSATRCTRDDRSSSTGTAASTSSLRQGAVPVASERDLTRSRCAGCCVSDDLLWLCRVAAGQRLGSAVDRLGGGSHTACGSRDAVRVESEARWP
jgi:hypothetical protein